MFMSRTPLQGMREQHDRQHPDSRRNDGPPGETGVGDLRIRGGLIEKIALGKTLEPMDDELFVDGTGST